MAKTNITIVANTDTYENLKTFSEIEQLNETVRTYKERYAPQLTKSALHVLDMLHRYSAKFLGVSFLYKNTIAEHLGISRRTVIRACQLLEELGVIKQYEMKREKDRLQTGNAIVIQPIKEEKTEVVTQENAVLSHLENNIFLKQKHHNNHLNNSRSPYIKYVPKALQHFQALFGKHIKDIYGRIWLAAKKLGIKVDQDTMQRIGFMAMETLKRYVKEGRVLSKEQMCKCAYVIAFNQLQQRVDSGEIVDFKYFYGTLLEKIGTGKASSPMPTADAPTNVLNALGVY